MAMAEPITAYKGLDQDFRCRGFQYAVGETYRLDGEAPARCTERGFHACLSPLDVWRYYPPATSRFAVVELRGEIDRGSADSKVASAEITIKAELRLGDFIQRAVSWMMRAAKVAAGHDSHLAAAGHDSHLAAAGYGSHLAAAGHRSHLAAAGYGSHLAAAGYGSHLAASGDGSHLAASGHSSHLAASGYRSHLAASGYGSHLAASGEHSVCVAARPVASISAGPGGLLAAPWHDGTRWRLAVGYVGENGIEPNVAYRVDDRGRFVRVEEARS
jgi:hypothetical protein